LFANKGLGAKARADIDFLLFPPKRNNQEEKRESADNCDRADISASKTRKIEVLQRVKASCTIL